jgi:catechol 2,3-dioxygenase-like lactoylglutathione lyase family enzyme
MIHHISAVTFAVRAMPEAITFYTQLGFTLVYGRVLSQSSIFGQNPKIGCQEFNDLQTPKLSKKQLCDRTV